MREQTGGSARVILAKRVGLLTRDVKMALQPFTLAQLARGAGMRVEEVRFCRDSGLLLAPANFFSPVASIATVLLLMVSYQCDQRDSPKTV